MNGTVLVVAKAPLPGRSMTRLVPPLRSDEAARLHTALLADTLAACLLEVADVRVLYGAPEDEAPLRKELGPGAVLEQQDGAGLADALHLAVERHRSRGPVAVISSDIPGIPPGSLTQAFTSLEGGTDVVLGPAHDGGYWLIAMREPHAAPFREIPWSTPAVYAVTVERCREAELTVDLVEPWRDIDTPADLAAIASLRDSLPAPRTRALLAGLSNLSEPAPYRLRASRLLDASPWRTVLVDNLANGSRSTRYTYLAMPRAVFVVALTPEKEIVLVRQYRHPVRDWTLEVPAGSLHEGETALEAARRELEEETGARAKRWRHLTTFYSSSAHLSLRSDIYLATELTLDAPRPDDGEDITAVRLPWSEAVGRARGGGFLEGQTALAILLAAAALDEEGE